MVQIIPPAVTVRHGGANIVGRVNAKMITATELRATPITNWVLT